MPSRGITPSTRPERRDDGVNTQVARRGRVLARVGVRPGTTGYTETKGASGIVFAMMAHAAATNPAAPMYVGMEMPAATALVAMLAIDVLVRSSRGIDYACHAGGALFGLAFYEYCKL